MTTQEIDDLIATNEELVVLRRRGASGWAKLRTLDIDDPMAATWNDPATIRTTRGVAKAMQRRSTYGECFIIERVADLEGFELPRVGGAEM